MAVMGLVTLAACGGDPFQVIEDTEFDASLGVDLEMMERLDNGVYIMDEVLGDGPEVTYGADITITYTGWLADGTQFLSQEGVSFPVIEDQGALPGFNTGILGMRPGGTRLIILPPEQAYGDREVGIIPPGSILVFEVTMDEVVPP